MHNRIKNFINKFTDNGTNEAVIDKFMNGYCFHFTEILAATAIVMFEKVIDEECNGNYEELIQTMYAEVENHYGLRVGDRIYDVTGDVTDKYNWVDYFELYKRDPALASRLERDCIRKEDF